MSCLKHPIRKSAATWILKSPTLWLGELFGSVINVIILGGQEKTGSQVYPLHPGWLLPANACWVTQRWITDSAGVCSGVLEAFHIPAGANVYLISSWGYSVDLANLIWLYNSFKIYVFVYTYVYVHKPMSVCLYVCLYIIIFQECTVT